MGKLVAYTTVLCAVLVVMAAGVAVRYREASARLFVAQEGARDRSLECDTPELARLDLDTTAVWACRSSGDARGRSASAIRTR